MEWLNNILYWHWLIAGVLLIILEMLAPGAYFLWMGVAAFIVGGALYFIPSMIWLVQIVIFGVISVVSLVLYKRYQRNNDEPSDQPVLNRRGEQYIGRVFNLEEPIINGIGKVKVDDSTWKVAGADYPVGTKVRVVSVDGTTFKVEAETSYIES